MGYYVSSITAIVDDRGHTFFAYFLPARRLRYDWVNAFFGKNFSTIASRIGPNGVIVTPTEHATSAFTDEVRAALEELDQRTKRAEPVLETGYPFLIVSKTPLGAEHPDPDPDAESRNAVAINLAAVKDESELAALVDTVIYSGVQNDGRDVVAVASGLARDLAKDDDPDGGWPEYLSEAVQLRPNVFGVGVDVGGVAKVVRAAWRKRSAQRLHKELGR
jgi:hypothetical protein